MNIKENCNRAGCKDVFKSFLVKNAFYSGMEEIPTINPIDDLPKKVISFIEALKSNEYDAWIHFYIDDFHFERVWNNIYRYLSMFRKFEGVILPDFSVYRDMSYSIQCYQIYRSRAVGNYLQKLGIKVIANVRYGDERTYDVSCFGLSKGQTIAIGTNGTVKNILDRKYLDEGFDYVVNTIAPKHIVIYGSVTDHINEVTKEKSIHIINFRSVMFARYGSK